MSKVGKEHWTIVNIIFRYLCGTADYAILYQGRPRPNRVSDVHQFVSLDWVGDFCHKISKLVIVITYSFQGQQVAQVHGLRKKHKSATLREVQYGIESSE
jgi:hypothetical protein